MRRRTRILAAVLVATMLVSVLSVLLLRERQRLYKVTLLPSLGGNMTAATGINDRGQVTGFAQTPDGVFHFFLWEREHGMQDLGPATQGTFHIDATGQIAGTTQDASWNLRAFLWDHVQGMRLLGTLGGKESVALGLNNRGQVVGRSQTAAGPSHAFVWDEVTGMRDLGTFGGAKSEALSINDAGLVFGRADSATQEYQAFYWDSEKGMTAAGPAAPSDVMWYGMNERGYAVGIDRHAQLFLWHRDAGIRRLFQTGGSYIQPVVNDANQILFGEASYNLFTQWFSRFVEPTFLCYVWDPDRGRISLDNCVRHKWGKTLYMWDLNNKGCLVGALAHERRQRSRAVLLEPIPEQWRK